MGVSKACESLEETTGHYETEHNTSIQQITGQNIASLTDAHDAEHRKDKRPRLSDARGDKKTFENADTVLLIYRDAWYHYESYDGNSEYVEFILAKHATGKTGNAQLRFDRNCGRFEEDKEVMAN